MKFRIEATTDHTVFRVQLNRWWTLDFWFSGFIWTDYFAVSYDTEQEAVEAIELYKKRYTEI